MTPNSQASRTAALLPNPEAGEHRFVLWLDQIEPSHRSRVGGKAANLAAMKMAELPVPPAFCVTTAAFDAFRASCPALEGITARVTRVSVDQPESVAGLSQEARECMDHAEILPEIRTAVLNAWRILGADRLYAVRSSATVEDGTESSFAGQFDSILEVSGDEALLRAIKACWMSMFSERTIAYRVKRGVAMDGIAMAVLVQEFITADCSGVAFTADPMTGMTHRLLVECVAGSGESLVSGHARPDRFLVGKTSRRVLAIPDPDREAAATPRRKIEPRLPQLLDLALRTERLFGAPQDIEWTQRGQELFLLQSRPITTHGHAAAADSGSIWSNLNTTENFQGVVTPMAWSFLNTCSRRIGDRFLGGLGIDTEHEPWLGLVAGRVYMNVTTVRKLLGAVPGCGRLPLGIILGGFQDALPVEDDSVPGARGGSLSLGQRLRGSFAVAGSLFERVAWGSRGACLNRLHRSLAPFLAVDPGTLTETELTAHLQRLLDFGYRRFELPVVLGLGLAAAVILRPVCAKWLGDSHGSVANQLLSRAGGMASAESALDLWRLAVWTSQDERLRNDVLGATHFASLEALVAGSEPGREFLRRWADIMKQHGHRGKGEIDLAAPRWSESPEEVLGLLRHYLENVGQVDLLSTLDQRTREREQLLATSRARIRNPLRRWAFGVLVRQAQAGLVYRENFKGELLRVVAHVRTLLLNLGERWTRSGKLSARDDVFFLTLEEIAPVQTGDAAVDARALIQARREEFRRHQALTPPPVVVGKFDPARHTPLPANARATVLCGLPVSAGVVTGRARVIMDGDSKERVLPGEILVAPYTDPGWTPFFLTAAGVVVDLGGQLSHGSVVAREYGLPAVVNVRCATQVIRTGQLVRVDGDHGIVTVMSTADPEKLDSRANGAIV